MNTGKRTFGRTLFDHWLFRKIKQHPAVSVYFFLLILIKLFFTGKAVLAVPGNYYLRHLEILQEIGLFLLYPALMLLVLCILPKHKILAVILAIIPVALPLVRIVHAPKALDYSRKIGCTANLRKIADSCAAYAADHQGYYPPSLEKLVELKYINIETLHCPGSRWHNPGENDYLYHGAGVQLGKECAGAVLVQDKPGNHIPGRYGTKLLFEDSFVPME